MMRWIVGSSLKLRYIVVALAAMMMYFGLAQIRDMPVDVFRVCSAASGNPDPIVGPVRRRGRGAGHRPLEQALQGVADLDEIRSKSVPQLSSIQLIFEPGTDLLKSRRLVQERIDAVTAQLPTWASPPFMIQPLSATSRVMKIGLSSSDRSLIEMSMISYWTIRERLLRVPGVANVAIWGERLQMLQVQTEPDRLEAHDVSLQQVMTATSQALDAGLLQFSTGSLIGTGGFVETPNQRLASATSNPSPRRPSWHRSPSRSPTARPCGCRTWPGWSRITSRSSAMRSSTTGRGSC